MNYRAGPNVAPYLLAARKCAAFLKRLQFVMYHPKAEVYAILCADAPQDSLAGWIVIATCDAYDVQMHPEHNGPEVGLNNNGEAHAHL